MQNNNFYKSLEFFMQETTSNVNKLDRQVKNNYKNSIIFESSFNDYKFYFKVINSCQGYVEIVVNGEETNVEILLNDLPLFTGKIKKSKIFYCGFYVGENKIVVNVDNCEYYLKIHGNVEYLTEKSSLSVANFIENNVLAYFNGYSVMFFLESNSSLQLLNSVEKVISGSIIGVNGNLLYVAYVDDKSDAYIGCLNINTNVFSMLINLNYKAISIGGYFNNDKFVIYVSRLNAVYKAEFSLTQPIVFNAINVTGKKLSVNYLIKDAFICIDNVNTAKIAILNGENYFCYTLPRGSNYHLYFDNNQYLIGYYDGVLYRNITFNNGKVISDTPVAYTREMIKIQNKTFIYQNGSVKVEKE